LGRSSSSCENHSTMGTRTGSLAVFNRYIVGRKAHAVPVQSTLWAQRLWLKTWRLGGLAIAAMGSSTAFSSMPMGSVTSVQGVPKNIKVYYGDMPFWRAECVRMALFLGDVPFDDVRDSKREALKAEGKLTFGATPVLEVDGRILSQTQAMASYTSKLAGLHPSDPWAAAKVDEALNGCTDVTVTIGQTFRLPAEEKIAARRKLIAPDGRLSMHLGGLESIITQNGSQGRVAGDFITVADLAIWRLVGWLSSGVIDGIPKDYISRTFPHITALCAKVDSHPKVQDWTEKHAKFYKK